MGYNPCPSVSPSGLDTVSPQALGTDIEYSLQSNALSAKSMLGGRVALTQFFFSSSSLAIWVPWALHSLSASSICRKD